MSKRMRSILRQAKRDGLECADAWKTIYDSTVDTAQKDKWSKAELAATLTDHFSELRAAYGETEIAKLRRQYTTVASAKHRRGWLRTLLDFVRGDNA